MTYHHDASHITLATKVIIEQGYNLVLTIRFAQYHVKNI